MSNNNQNDTSTGQKSQTKDPKTIVSNQDKLINQMLNSYINTFNNICPLRYKEEQLPTIKIRRQVGFTVPSNASGNILLRATAHQGSWLIIIESASTVVTNDLSASVWTTVATIATPYGTNTGPYVAGAIAIRAKYVGPLLNRGGINYILQFTGHEADTVNDNIIFASSSPHGYVAPIDEHWAYMRYKHQSVSSGNQTIGTQAVIGYFYSSGLPISSTCMYYEAVYDGEYIPQISEEYLLPTSGPTMSKIADQQAVALIQQRKVDQKAHAHQNDKPEHFKVKEHLESADASWVEYFKTKGKEAYSMVEPILELGVELLFPEFKTITNVFTSALGQLTNSIKNQKAPDKADSKNQEKSINKPKKLNMSRSKNNSVYTFQKARR